MWNTIKLLPFGTSTRCQYPSQRALSDISSRIVNNDDKPMSRTLILQTYAHNHVRVSHSL